MAVFGGKGGVDVKFWFCDPQKARPCAEPHLLTYFALMSVVAAQSHRAQFLGERGCRLDPE